MPEFRVIEEGLIPIYSGHQNGNAVNARELHFFLQVGLKFSDWIQKRLFDYHFTEGEDFFRETGKSYGGRPPVEFFLTMDTAKEIAMVENNDQGRRVRKYFIDVENRAKKAAADMAAVSSDPVTLLELQVKALREHQNRIEALEAKTAADEAARAEQAKQIETLGHRVTNLDLADIDGTPRQRLVAMVKRYAWQTKITYPLAWRHFDTAFSTAFRINLTARRQNYARANGLDKVDRPEYLEAAGLLEDAIRVADKMLNDGKAVSA